MGRITEKHFSPDGKFSYSFWKDGNTTKPPLLIIPGFTGTHGDLLGFAREFKDLFDVIIPDLPGWGDSPKGSYHLTIDGYANFIHDLLKSLHLQKIYLVGHCMGTAVAVQFAYTYPREVISLFLIGAPYLQGSWSNSLFEHLARVSMKMPKFLRPLFFFFRSRIFAIPLGFFVLQTKSIRKKIRTIFFNAYKQQFQDEDVVEKNWNSLVLFDYAKLKHLTMPIHLFQGEKDILVPTVQAKKLQKVNPQATLDIIPHAGHSAPVEAPKVLSEKMFHFLTK